MAFQCSSQRPWGVHAPVRNDENCPRCGWIAPGPIQDALLDAAEAAAAAQAALDRAAGLGWTVHEGGLGDSLAA
jgi:hypothetical protein